MHRNSENGTIILTPEDASKHSATVILCHGLGDTAEGWLDPAQVRIQWMILCIVELRYNFMVQSINLFHFVWPIFFLTFFFDFV